MGQLEQNLCNARGYAYDPGNNYCVYTGNKDGTTQYFDPATGTQLTAPLIAADPATLVWPNTRPLGQAVPPVPVPMTVPGFGTPAAAAGASTDFFSSATGFLTAPGLFGVPNWALIGIAVLAVVIVTQMDGKGKKGGGLF